LLQSMYPGLQRRALAARLTASVALVVLKTAADPSAG